VDAGARGAGLGVTQAGAPPGADLGCSSEYSIGTFQAIRIYLNNEIYELEKGLIAAEKSLKPDGILAVISFHSIEDRIIKKFLVDCSKSQADSRYLPENSKNNNSFEILTRKPISPSEKEIATNNRSRSAKLRVAKRTNSPSCFGEEE